MKFSIVFQSSGDSLLCKSDCPDLLDAYIDFINNHDANEFSLTNTNFKLEQNFDELLSTLTFFNNSFFADINGVFDIPVSKIDMLDQNYLNKIHAKYVNSQFNMMDIQSLKRSNFAYKLKHLFELLSDDETQVNTTTILHKYSLYDLYHNINTLVHSLENKFNKLKFKANFNNWIEMENTFPKSYTSNYIKNVSIAFYHSGRTLHNKFVTWDNNLTHRDENTFDQLIGYIELNLNRQETVDYSPEYKEWCEKNKRQPSGEFLNLGNICDLEYKLTDYRKIIYRNLSNNNKFKLVLDKG